MDSAVVTEIASQLGIAVENAGQFIEDILPQYASMKMIETAFIDLMFLIPTIVLLVVTIRTYRRWKKEMDERKSHYNRLVDFFDDHIVICMAALLWTLLAFLVILIFTMSNLGWFIAPEAKLLETMLQSLRG